MNKIVVGLLIAVCVLGVMLIMLNDHLGNSVTSNVIEKQEEIGVATKQENAEQQTGALAIPLEKKGDEQIASSAQLVTNEKKLEAHEPAGNGEMDKPLEMPKVAEATQPAVPEGKANIVPVAPVAPVESNAAKNIAQQETPKTQAPPKTPVATEKMQTSVDEKSTKVAEKIDEKKTVTAVKIPENSSKSSQTGTKQDAPKPNIDTKNEKKPVADKRNVASSSIKLFVVFAREKGATVRIRANNAIPYSTSELHNPERLMIDLAGEWDVKAPGVPKNPIVNNVRVGKTQNTTRIVIDLKEKPRKKRVAVTDKKDGLDVFLDQ